MSGSLLLLLAFFLIGLLLIAVPLGGWLAALAEGRWRWHALARFERAFFRLAGIRAEHDMSWRDYALALLAFHGVGLLALYLLQRLQGFLPGASGLPAISPELAFNTASSFVTNTNWQAYAGESTMSHLTQMAGLGLQNFLSAAIGIAVAFAAIRGFARQESRGIGNFWVDISRVTLFLLLPLAFVFALFLAGQGVVQSFDRTASVQLLDPVAGQSAEQTIPLGPVASQEAIKILGTNGGGFFNANSAHPFENPTFLSNFLQMLAILSLPAALCLCFGRMVGDRRQGWALLTAMTLVFAIAVLAVGAFETASNPRLADLPVDQAGGNLEGKETRFGIAASALFATATTAASCGAVNAMHDSLMPLAGMVPLWLMQIGEVIFGGVGSGLYGLLIFALLTVFAAGLMIGRSPEYLGKELAAYEMKMVSIVLLLPSFLVLAGTALAVATVAGRAGIQDPGPHGFTEVLYAFSSAANNNGSAFAGLTATSPFYQYLLGSLMFLGRLGVIVPVLAIAGSLAGKRRRAQTVGSLPTHGPLFIALLIGTIAIVGALTYLPALALGPIADHLLLFHEAP
jgi:K+-transporting ATPase ATPase A chain